LVVSGVHTPEFSFECEIDPERQATKERGIDYSVALDNDLRAAFVSTRTPVALLLGTKLRRLISWRPGACFRRGSGHAATPRPLSSAGLASYLAYGDRVVIVQALIAESARNDDNRR
jgi:hypothetical protein